MFRCVTMNKGTMVGLALFLVGIVIWALYGLYLGFNEIMQMLNWATVFIGGLIIIGLAVMFISIIIDQVKTMDKMKEKIDKEDFEP